MAFPKKGSFASPPSSPLPIEKNLAKQIKELFENPDFDVDPIYINNDRQVTKEIKEILSIYNNSKEWDQQLNAIQRGMSIVKGGACNHISFIQHVNDLVPMLSETIMNYRSTLVKYSCLFIAQLSINLGRQIENAAESLLSTLFKPTTHGTQIISDSCKHAILSIAKYVQSPKIVKAFLAQASSKSAVQRIIVANSLAIVLKNWERRDYQRLLPQIEKTISKLVSDANPDARSFAREARSLLGQVSNQTEVSYKVPQTRPKRAQSIDSRPKTRKHEVKTQLFNRPDDLDPLESIKQLIVQGEESEIVKNAEKIAQEIVEGMSSESPITASTSMSLFSETIKVIPSEYEKHMNVILASALASTESPVTRTKRLGASVLSALLKQFGAEKVIETAVKIDDASSYVDFITATAIAEPSVLENNDVLNALTILSHSPNASPRLADLLDNYKKKKENKEKEKETEKEENININKSESEDGLSPPKPRRNPSPMPTPEPPKAAEVEESKLTTSNTQRPSGFAQTMKPQKPILIEPNEIKPKKKPEVENKPKKSDTDIPLQSSKIEPKKVENVEEEVKKKPPKFQVCAESAFEIPASDTAPAQEDSTKLGKQNTEEEEFDDTAFMKHKMESPVKDSRPIPGLREEEEPVPKRLAKRPAFNNGIETEKQAIIPLDEEDLKAISFIPSHEEDFKPKRFVGKKKEPKYEPIRKPRQQQQTAVVNDSDDDDFIVHQRPRPASVTRRAPATAGPILEPKQVLENPKAPIETEKPVPLHRPKAAPEEPIQKFNAKPRLKPAVETLRRPKPNADEAIEPKTVIHGIKKDEEEQKSWVKPAAPFATSFDPPPPPDTQAQRLLTKLNTTSDKSSVLRRIASYTNRTQAKDFRVYLPSILELSRSEFRDDAETCIQAIGRFVKPSVLIDTTITLLDSPHPRDAIEFLGRVGSSSPAEFKARLPDAMRKLRTLCADPSPEVRKASVFCIVDAWAAVGPSFESEVAKLPPVTKKLVAHYYGQRK